MTNITLFSRKKLAVLLAKVTRKNYNIINKPSKSEKCFPIDDKKYGMNSINDIVRAIPRRSGLSSSGYCT